MEWLSHRMSAFEIESNPVEIQSLVDQRKRPDYRQNKIEVGKRG